MDWPVNITDLGVAVILLLSGLLAFVRGFFKEVFTIAAWIGAIFVALYGLPYVKPLVQIHVPGETLAALIAGVGLFIVAVIILSVVGHYLSALVRTDHLNAVDRSLGFLFGLVRGSVLVVLAFLLVRWAVEEPDYPPWLRDARSLPLIERGAALALLLVPDYLRSDLDRAREAARRESEEALRRQTLRALTDPPARTGTARDNGGYTQSERQDMNRAIRSTR